MILEKPMQRETDFLIIGSGIAGLSLALKCSKLGRVILISKSALNEGSTRYAQGGIASVFSTDDSFENHIKDTLDAGDGLCKLEAVKVTVEEGPSRVRELIDQGVPFEKNKNVEIHSDFDLTQEGGHRARRILHATDFTGEAIENTLIELIRKDPKIDVLEFHSAIDLITEKTRAKILKKKINHTDRCIGAYILDIKKNNIFSIRARFTVLATGGAGKVYLYTSNPDTSTGDGIAMAHRIGARISNLEFMQFHPTCLYLKNSKTISKPRAKSFLISEALRGEGGILKNREGVTFMENYHPMKNLAPRDIVARAIDSEMKRHGDDCVYLDMTHVETSKGEKGYLKKRFPNIFEYCLSVGIDMTKDTIPVVPAAHYTCGGVVTDLNGESSIQNLFAIGETASTGLHGANRLASNSLLEGVVFSHRAFTEFQKRIQTIKSSKNDSSILPEPLPEWDEGMAVPMEERIDIHHTWKELRTLMWNYVGIVRSNKRLARARVRLGIIRHEVQEYYWHYLLTADLIELRNLVTVADLILQCAINRKESRGLHFNTDYPFHDDQYFLNDTIV